MGPHGRQREGHGAGEAKGGTMGGIRGTMGEVMARTLWDKSPGRPWGGGGAGDLHPTLLYQTLCQTGMCPPPTPQRLLFERVCLRACRRQPQMVWHHAHESVSNIAISNVQCAARPRAVPCKTCRNTAISDVAQYAVERSRNGQACDTFKAINSWAKISWTWCGSDQ